MNAFNKETTQSIVNRFVDLHKQDNINDWTHHAGYKDKIESIYHEVILSQANKFDYEAKDSSSYIEISSAESKAGRAVIFEFDPVLND